ncbi:MAG: DUF3662 and FHA domain-containing protein [Coriobacteriia bacterium]|nr:DUF3662 and FHA domain-containing protein [Coriobacteriia bacterium]
MGVLDKFEGGIEDAFDKVSARVFKGTIEPAQVARRAEKQMKREKLVGSGKQYAPTLYTVLVSSKDDKRLFAFYPTMSNEIETYLMGRGADIGLTFDGRPLVRFIVDKKLKSGRFDVIAESVAAEIIEQLRIEEAKYLGLTPDIDDWPEPLEVSPAQSSLAEQSAPKAENSIDESQNSLPDTPLPVAAPAGLPQAMQDSPAVRASVNTAKPDGSLSSPYTLEPDEPAPNSGLRDALREAHSDLVEKGISISSQDDSLKNAKSTKKERAKGEALLIDHTSGQMFALYTTSMTIGRDESNEIVINDANASRKHAELRQNVLGTWKIIDLNSTNGTLVNGKAVDQMVLRENDELTIGVTILEIRGTHIPDTQVPESISRRRLAGSTGERSEKDGLQADTPLKCIND